MGQELRSIKLKIYFLISRIFITLGIMLLVCLAAYALYSSLTSVLFLDPFVFIIILFLTLLALEISL